jgi:hypothetical protein
VSGIALIVTHFSRNFVIREIHLLASKSPLFWRFLVQYGDSEAVLTIILKVSWLSTRLEKNSKQTVDKIQ